MVLARYHDTCSGSVSSISSPAILTERQVQPCPYGLPTVLAILLSSNYWEVRPEGPLVPDDPRHQSDASSIREWSVGVSSRTHALEAYGAMYRYLGYATKCAKDEKTNRFVFELGA